jgi:hypothetical protein
MKATRFLNFCILLVLPFYIHGQDTLVLCKKRDRNIEFKIPLNVYNVGLKFSNRKREKVIIKDFKDSTFTVGKWYYNSKDTVQKNQITAYWKSYKRSKEKKYPEYSEILKYNAIFFPHEEDIISKEVNVIVVPNCCRTETQKFNKAMNIITLTSAVGLLTTIFTDNMQLVAGTAAFTLTAWSVDLITSRKKINLRKKWDVKKVIGA